MEAKEFVHSILDIVYDVCSGRDNGARTNERINARVQELQSHLDGLAESLKTEREISVCLQEQIDGLIDDASKAKETYLWWATLPVDIDARIDDIVIRADELLRVNVPSCFDWAAETPIEFLDVYSCTALLSALFAASTVEPARYNAIGARVYTRLKLIAPERVDALLRGLYEP